MMTDDDRKLLDAFSKAAVAIAPLDVRQRLRVLRALTVLVQYDLEEKLESPAGKDAATFVLTDELIKGPLS